MTTLIALVSILAVLVVTLAAQVMVTADKLADCEAALRRAKLRNDRLAAKVDALELSSAAKVVRNIDEHQQARTSRSL